jgi:hypothetical protein
MSKLLAALDGKKTYIMIGLGVLTVAAQLLHYITLNVMLTLLPLEGFGSVAALRSAITNLENQALSNTTIDTAPSSTTNPNA